MKKLMATSLAAVVIGLAGTALAEDADTGTAPVRAPSNAFEVTVATGYTQGMGSLAKGTVISDVARGGFGVSLGLGYRLSPVFMIGASGQYQEFASEITNVHVRGFAPSIDAAFHIIPFERVDPWIQIGTGYRFLWTVPQGTADNTLWHGFEIAKILVGADIRVSPDVAIAPVLGADINAYAWNAVGSQTSKAISDVRASTYIFGGAMGRFDLGGTRGQAATTRVGLR